MTNKVNPNTFYQALDSAIRRKHICKGHLPGVHSEGSYSRWWEMLLN